MRAVKGNLDHSLNRCLRQGGMRFDGRSQKILTPLLC